MSMNPPIADWKGKVVWIVGGSTGIGRATATRLHGLGARVIVSARHADRLEAFVREHPGAQAEVVDVTEARSVHAAATRLVDRHGRLDLVVYSAGHYLAMTAQTFDLEEARRHWKVNYDGALGLLDACLPILLKQGFGHLSLVASVAAYRGLPKAMAYGPTKAALQHLADTLYLDLRLENIGVSVVNPGFVDTPLTAGNQFPMPALLSPEQAALHIESGWRRGLYEIHFPKRFSLWLKLLSLLPHRLYFAIVRRVTGA